MLGRQSRWSAYIGGLYAEGGYTGPGGKYQPAGVVHKGEYVMNAAATSGIGVAALNRLQGYADGGFVSDRLPKPSFGLPAYRGGSNGGAAGAPQNVHVTVGIEMNANGEWQGYVKDVAQTTSAKTVSATMESSVVRRSRGLRWQIRADAPPMTISGDPE